MLHSEKKYPGNFSVASGFKASDRLNAAFTSARHVAHDKSGGQYDAAVPLNQHPQAMRLFLTELLEQLTKAASAPRAELQRVRSKQPDCQPEVLRP